MFSKPVTSIDGIELTRSVRLATKPNHVVRIKKEVGANVCLTCDILLLTVSVTSQKVSHTYLISLCVAQQVEQSFEVILE